MAQHPNTKKSVHKYYVSTYHKVLKMRAILYEKYGNKKSLSRWIEEQYDIAIADFYETDKESK